MFITKYLKQIDIVTNVAIKDGFEILFNSKSCEQ